MGHFRTAIVGLNPIQAELQLPMLLRSGSFMVGETKRQTLIASLAPARAKIEAGVVAKADQQ
jgi:hypothetical protein